MLLRENRKLSHGEAVPSPSQTLAELKCFRDIHDCCSPYNASQVQVSRVGKIKQEGGLLLILHYLQQP